MPEDVIENLLLIVEVGNNVPIKLCIDKVENIRIRHDIYSNTRTLLIALITATWVRSW